MTKIAIFFLRLYQASLTLFFGKCCRFYPSCSQYMIDAILKKGLWKGLLLGSKRLLKCGPWHPGGLDPVPDQEEAGIRSSSPMRSRSDSK